LWRLTRELLKLGQSVTLESGFWLRSDRDEKRLGARALGVIVELPYPDGPLEKLWRRLELRNLSPEWGTGTVPVRCDQLEHWVTPLEPSRPTGARTLRPRRVTPGSDAGTRRYSTFSSHDGRISRAVLASGSSRTILLGEDLSSRM